MHRRAPPTITMMFPVKFIRFSRWAVLVFLLSVATPMVTDGLFFGNEPLLFPELECYIKFFLVNFNPETFDQYDTYFRDDTIVELAQTGRYVGPEDVKEYIRFMYKDFSPYFVEGPTSPHTTISFTGYENGQCVFLSIFHAQFTFDQDYTTTDTPTVRYEYMFKIFFNFGENYISRMHVYIADETLQTVFANYFDSDKTRQFICDTMAGPCAAIVETPPNCLAALKTLPLAHDTSRVDGNSQGCRALHAVFAAVNDVHCPHISFVSMEDVNGKIKCQTVGTIEPEDLFTVEDIQAFQVVAEAVGIDPATGILVVEPSAIKTERCGIVCIGIFCLDRCGIFGRLFG